MISTVRRFRNLARERGMTTLMFFTAFVLGLWLLLGLIRSGGLLTECPPQCAIHRSAQPLV